MKNIIPIVLPLNYLAPRFWGAVGAIVGGIGSALVSKKSAEDQTEAQLDSSSTAYQRAVKDMRAAGINPMLAAKTGGASSISGAAYNADALAKVANSAVSAMRGRQEINNLEATEDKTKQETKTGVSQERLNNYAADQAFSASELNRANEARAKEETENLKQQNRVLRRDARAAEIEEKILDEAPVLRFLKMIGVDASTAKGLLGGKK